MEPHLHLSTIRRRRRHAIHSLATTSLIRWQHHAQAARAIVHDLVTIHIAVDTEVVPAALALVPRALARASALRLLRSLLLLHAVRVAIPLAVRAAFLRRRRSSLRHRRDGWKRRETRFALGAADLTRTLPGDL